MKPCRRNGIIKSIIFAALVISGAAFYSSCVSAGNAAAGNDSLVIRDAKSGRVYGKWFLEEPKEFAIEFIHSVNQSPVRDYFIIENNMIRLVALRYYSFGAGMPTGLEEGQTLSFDGDAMVISGYRASFKELNYIVGTVSDHLLFINNSESISLRNLCGRNANIKISFE